MATLLGFVRPLHLQVNMHIISQSQLAELGVLREHRRAFAVEDSLELRRPDAVVPSTQGATGVPPVAGLHRGTAFSPVAAYRVRTSFSRRTLFSIYESNGFIGIAYSITVTISVVPGTLETPATGTR